VTPAWHDLDALAQREAVLVADGDIAALTPLYERRAELLAALPRPLPREALEPLQRALSAQRATATALMARRDAIAAELGRLNHGRTGVQGYARAADFRS
jgi:hypothetical protein